MAASEKAYVTRIERKKGVVYRIRIWDPVLFKHESRTVELPKDLSGKKLDTWLQKEIDSMENRVKYRTSTTSPGTPFGEFFLGEWFEEASKTNDEAGMYEYKQTYNRHLKDSLGPVPLDKIVPRTMDCLYEELRAKGLSDDFVYRMHKLIGQVLGEAKRRGIIDVNVARERMHAPKRGKKDPFDDSKAMSPEQISILMDHLSKETLEWRTFIYLLLITGMRRGEACALMWDSVDFKNRRIKICRAARRIPHKGIEIKDPKTFTSNRYVNMTPDLEKLLLELKEKSSLSDEEFVFKGRTDPNGPMHPDSATAHISKFSEKCGFDFMTKDLRSTFVSMLISVLDVDPRTAQDIVGHSSIDVTLGIYARSKEAPRRKAQESYEAFIKKRCEDALEVVADEDGER